MNILLNTYTTVMNFYRDAFNTAFEGSMSQNSDLGFSFQFIKKKGNFWSFFKTFFSRLLNVKTRT